MALFTDIRGLGPSMVLLPWFGLDHSAMAAAFEPLFTTSSTWSRIYVDLPGTGNSPAVAPNSDAVLNAIIATVDELIGGQQFVVAGCSYGGYLAANLARRLPGRVSGLLTVCGGVKIRPQDRNLSGVLPSEPHNGWLDEVPVELHEQFRLGIGRQSAEVANRVAAAIALCGATDGAYLADLRTNGYRLSDEGAAWQFQGSALLLTGRRDRIAGYKDACDSLAHYEHSTFVTVGEVGHYIPFEEPELFHALASHWLAGIRVD